MDKYDIINNGYYDTFLFCLRGSQKRLYGTSVDTPIDRHDNSLDINSSNLFDFDFNGLSCDVVRECYKIFNARRQRSKRIKDKLVIMLQKPCLFLTLTFNDYWLNRCNETTLRRYIVNFLKSFDVPCIANKDYGSKNGRLHFHAVIQLDRIDFSLYKYGSINFKKIYGDYSPQKISKYVTDVEKLVNHATKKTVTSHTIFLNFKYNPTQISFFDKK